MSSRNYTRRNRPITACRECHRRKQKCDRLKPCNVCLVRNVPEKCLYGDDVAKLVKASKASLAAAPLTPPSDEDSIPEHDENNDTANTIDEQIGYSAFSDNSFIDLYKSIDAVYVPTAGSLGLSTAPLRPDLQEKYFKALSQTPSEPVCQSLIDIYFREADWYFMSLDKYYFDRLYAAWKASGLINNNSVALEQYPRDLQHFPALLFQTLAVGLQFSPSDAEPLKLLGLKDRSACEKQSQLYSDLGCEIMTLIGRQVASITGIEQDIMRTTWLKNCSRGTESWHSIGNAISQAHDLELHLESDISSAAGDQQFTYEEIWYDEYRRRVWARVFMLDSHMALVLGRPRHIHLDDCTAKWPTDCDIPNNIVGTKPEVPANGDVPSSFTFLIFLIDLGLKIHEVMSAKSKRSTQNNYHMVEKIHREVQEILATLPSTMRLQNPDTSWDVQKPFFPKLRQQILSSANSFLMKLHRPYISSSDDSRNAVISAALGTLDAQQGLFESMLSNPNQHRIYGFSFYTIDAAMLLSAVILDNYPTEEALVSHVHRSLQQAISRLAFLKDTSRVAASGETVLIQCLARMNARRSTLNGTTEGSYGASVFSHTSNLPDQWQLSDPYTLPDPHDFEPDPIQGISVPGQVF